MSSPKYGSLVTLGGGELKCRIRIVREYKHVVKVRYWMGDGWSDIQVAHPETVIHDGGRMAGWTALNYTRVVQR